MVGKNVRWFVSGGIRYPDAQTFRRVNRLKCITRSRYVDTASPSQLQQLFDRQLLGQVQTVSTNFLEHAYISQIA